MLGVALKTAGRAALEMERYVLDQKRSRGAAGNKVGPVVAGIDLIAFFSLLFTGKRNEKVWLGTHICWEECKLCLSSLCH